MRITIPSWSAPTCKCGGKTEIYLDVFNRKLRVKCVYCGRENSTSIPIEIGLLNLDSVSYIARSLVE